MNSKIRKSNETQYLDQMLAQNPAAAAKGLQNYIAHRLAVHDAELAEIRALRADSIRRNRIRSRERAREANRRREPRPLGPIAKKRLARKESKRYQKLIIPGPDSRRDLQFTIAGLRELVDSGVSVRLTERGRLTLETLNEPIPEEAIGFVTDCAATVAEWMSRYSPHRHCYPNARPTLIAGEEFEPRCPFCYWELPRKPADD